MCNNRRWLNPWEDPETSPWRCYWGEDFWEKHVLCNERDSDHDNDSDCNHDHNGDHGHHNNGCGHDDHCGCC